MSLICAAGSSQEGSLPTNTTRAGHGQEEPGGKDSVPELPPARAELTVPLQQLGKGVLEGSESLSDASGAQTGANNSDSSPCQTKHHKRHVNNLNKLSPPFKREGRCAGGCSGRAKRMQLLTRTTQNSCAQLPADGPSDRSLGATSPSLHSTGPSHSSGDKHRAPELWAECDRAGSAPGGASQLGNELCWPGEHG